METGALFPTTSAIPQRRATDRMPSVRHSERFIGKRELRDRVSISPQHIDRLEKAGQFPQRVRLGPGRVAWMETEIQAWMAAKIAASREAKRSDEA